MMKELKITCLLLLSASLIGCGLAEPNTPEEAVIDDVAPEVTQVNKPLGLLPANADEIRLQLTEEIDESSLSNLDALEIISPSGYQLKGTWSYAASNMELVYTIDRTNELDEVEDIPNNQTFRIILGHNGAPTITDLANNKLEYDGQFSTVSKHDIEIEISGLISGQQITVTELITNSSVNIDSSESKALIDVNLEENTNFQLGITQQPADGSYCTFDRAGGTILTRSAIVNITCSAVGPYNTDAPNWNDYYADGANFIHGGEQRALTTARYDNCSNISASDDLDVFNWSCEAVTGPPAAIRIFSTSIKDSKGLVDLINPSDPPKWKENFVRIQHGSSVFLTTEAAIWWNNPVIAAPANNLLDVSGAVYAVTKVSNTGPQNYLFKAPKISLVISELTTLVSTPTDGSAIEVRDVSNSWIEGKIDANGSQTGIEVNNAGFTILRNITISNAADTGIKINQTANTFLNNVVSRQNGGHGISIQSNLGSTGTILTNVFTINNEGSGLYLDSSFNKINAVTSNNNKVNGVTIIKPTNILSEIYTNNNAGNGVAFQGAQNNIISFLSSSSNDGNGIELTKTDSSPFKNLIVNATLANNKGSGVKFGDTVAQDTIDGVEGSIFQNVLDTFNAETSCGVNTCAGVTVITAADTDITDLFSFVKEGPEIADQLMLEEFSAIENDYEFENKFQSWANNADPTASVGAGSCRLDGAICRILDLRLNSTDTLALNSLAAPSSILSYTYRGDTTPFEFLNNSQEILNDDIGNDNGLCEANEACVATSNTGSYMGHGDLSVISNAAADSIGVTLHNYSENGIN